MPLAKWAKTAWTHRWFFAFLTIVLAAAGWQVARVYFGPAVAVDIVRRGELVQTVVATGHVENRFRVDIGSRITGTVAEVLVEEGQSVVKGEVLIELESRELKAAVSQAEGAVAQAQARLRQLQEVTLPAAKQTLAQGNANLRNAQQTYDRTAQLAAKGAATSAALDQARKDLDVARTVARIAELQVFTSGPRGSDYVLAETQLKQSEASLESAQARLKDASIIAPRDGVIISRNAERGAVVQPGKSLLVLSPAGETQLVLQIDERNIGQIKLGQKALASADAFPNQTFPAVVSYISPGVDLARASVEVKLNVPQPPDYLRQDMTVSVDIEVARRKDTLIVGRRDIYDILSGSPWIMVVRNGRAQKQTVQLGIEGTTTVEILKGASQGEMVVPASSGVKTEQHIRPLSQ